MLGVVRNRLRPPPATPALIPRLRLRDLIEGSPAAVVVIQADAGYGKTTAADELTAGRPRLWYGLTTADRDPLVFLAHLNAALADLRRPGPGTSSARRGAHSWPDELDAFLADLDACAEGPPVLVLDDYHSVHGSPVDEVVTRLLEGLPVEARVVVTTRVRIHLPGWARGRARGDILDIGRSLLAFDAEETRQYFQLSSGTQLSTAQADFLTEETEGWPIGLALIARQVQERDVPPEILLAHLPEGRRQIFDLLREQVFTDQPEEVQTFLLAVACLTVLDPQACAAVAGIDDARTQVLLTRIADGGVFCTGRGDGPYRLHNLFRDFLRAQLDDRRRRGFYERAAAHYRSRMMHEVAARLAVEGGLMQRAADDVGSIAGQLVASGRHPTLLDLSDPLGDVLDAHPDLRVQRSHALRLTSRYTEAVAEARRSRGCSGDPAVVQAAHAAEAMVHLDTVAPRPAAPLLSAMTRGLRRSDDHARTELLTMVAEQHVNAGRLRTAEHTLRRLTDDGVASEALRRTSIRLLARRGELPRARAALESTRPAAVRRVSHAHREDAALLAWVHGLLGHPDEAARQARIGILLGDDLRSPILSCVCWGRLGLAQLSGGAPDEAERSFRTSLAIADAMGLPRFRAEPLIGSALLAAQAGSPDETRRLGGEALATLEETGDRYLRAVATLAVGIGLALHGHPEADTWIATARRRADRVGDRYAVLLADQWAAHRALRDGDLERFATHAVPALEATSALALDEVWVTPPWLGLRDTEERRGWLTAAGTVTGIERYASYLAERLTPRGPSAVTPETHPMVRIQTLGRFRVTRPGTGEEAVAWPRRKAMEILWLLCSSQRHSLTRDEVVDRLWPDEDPEVAGLRFRVSLHALHLVLEPDRPQRAPTKVVRTTTNRLWLDPANVELDADTFRRLAAAARELPAPASLDAALEAVDLYEGPYLVEAADLDSTRSVREELAITFRDLVLSASQGLLDRGDPRRAASLGRRLWEQDPYCEPAYRIVAAAHLAVGDRAAAQRVHADCRNRLVHDVGIQPSWSLHDL